MIRLVIVRVGPLLQADSPESLGGYSIKKIRNPNSETNEMHQAKFEIRKRARGFYFDHAKFILNLGSRG
jgi:hypothetical protein